MSTRKQWKDDVIDVEELELNFQNPRLPNITDPLKVSAQATQEW